MKQIRFLKPYGEPEEGHLITSVIAYKKTPWLLTTVEKGFEEYEEVVTQYRHWLHINLWFVVLEFSWYSEINNPK